MTDQDTLDRLSRLEQRFDLLDQRIDERSKNLREAFDDVDKRIDGLRVDVDAISHHI